MTSPDVSATALFLCCLFGCAGAAPAPSRHDATSTDGGAQDGGRQQNATDAGPSQADAAEDSEVRGTNTNDDFTCPDAHGAMVKVPAGTFLYGGEKKPVTLAAFCIDRVEVRATDYAACVKAGGCEGHAKWPQCKEGDKHAPNSCRKNPADLPANWIDWFRAHEYCKWVGKHLPTEQQWEKAARGTDGRMYPWGNIISCKHAHWGRGVGFDECKSVGGLPDSLVAVTNYDAFASPYGALQMAGNVREWIDFRDDKSQLPNVHKMGISKGGDFREGKGGVTAVVSYNLVAPDVAADSQGFRCAAAAQFR